MTVEYHFQGYDSNSSPKYGFKVRPNILHMHADSSSAEPFYSSHTKESPLLLRELIYTYNIYDERTSLFLQGNVVNEQVC